MAAMIPPPRIDLIRHLPGRLGELPPAPRLSVLDEIGQDAAQVLHELHVALDRVFEELAEVAEEGHDVPGVEGVLLEKAVVADGLGGRGSDDESEHVRSLQPGDDLGLKISRADGAKVGDHGGKLVLWVNLKMYRTMCDAPE